MFVQRIFEFGQIIVGFGMIGRQVVSVFVIASRATKFLQQSTETSIFKTNVWQN